MKDATSQLRSATRRAKSDVANKLISMFLHELSRKICQDWKIGVDGEDYEKHVRLRFSNQCPYCRRNLANGDSVVEHLDGMNRQRAGLHVPGNVLIACKKCNSEKRRDDSRKNPALGDTGWESFLSHDGSRCAPSCQTCEYWKTIWNDKIERKSRLAENLQRIRVFRGEFPEFERVISSLAQTLPDLLAKLYSDCQFFAEKEVKILLENSLGSIPITPPASPPLKTIAARLHE